MNRLRFTITQGHMNVGVPHKSWCCPIAVTILEQLGEPVTPGQQAVKVFRTTITILGVKHNTPGNVRVWIDAYDRAPGSTMEGPNILANPPFAIGPFSFWLTEEDRQ